MQEIERETYPPRHFYATIRSKSLSKKCEVDWHFSFFSSFIFLKKNQGHHNKYVHLYQNRNRKIATETISAKCDPKGRYFFSYIMLIEISQLAILSPACFEK